MKKVVFLLFVGAIIGSGACRRFVAPTPKQTPVSKNGMTMMFYNVENLFDTINDPKILDDDFTPAGKYNWNTERYKTKLNRLAEVIATADGNIPGFVGLCEIENKSVLVDLAKEGALLNGHLAIIHQDSPDERGIDVAALYDPSIFTLLDYTYYSAVLPNDADPNTRDILYVKGQVGGEIVHVFVNHWPSRGGGQMETEANRVFVAQILKSKIDGILLSNANAKILCMGDFNDHPNDKSIHDVLKAGGEATSVLFDYMSDDQSRGEGSYWYKGEWGPLDQFIATPSLVNAKSGLAAPANAAAIGKKDFLLFTDKEGVQRPNRTYAGVSYKGGYSDHLPVFIHIESK